MKRWHPIIVVFLLAALSLAAATLSSPAQIPVRLDASQTSPPISKYLYGQFIEHLGQCIYGGLWAEMLEDRKFFYPIQGRTPAWTLLTPPESRWEGEGEPYEILIYSPWLPIGPQESVEMNGQSAYTGEHSPVIGLKEDERRGIYQPGLGLAEGKEYQGRIVLRGQGLHAPVEISLVWGHGAEDRQTVELNSVSSEYRTFHFTLVSSDSSDNGRLEIAGRGEGTLTVGTVSLMPSDNILGWRADTLQLVKALQAPIYRWPGGNFVSGYDWREGIGDRDRRPPRKNPAWKGIESNDVGLHEFIEFCRLVDAEPYIALNTGLGDAELAVQEVEYANGDSNTAMGRLRAENGHPEPFGVRWWAVGNEMYGEWQLGHMPLSAYVKKHNEIADAVWAVDPDAQLVGVGAVGEWSQTMLTESGSHMNLISEHLYWEDQEDLLAHVRQAPEGIRGVAEAHRAYREENPEVGEIPVALDEWNYWYGPFQFGELGVRYLLQDALGIAAGLHEMFRNSDIFTMANYAQTVNVLGAIKTSPTSAEMESTGLVLQLYRQQFGTIPIAVSADPTPLDISAALSEDNDFLTIAIVNPTHEHHLLELDISDMEFSGAGRKFVVTGPGRYAHNDPGKPRRVTLTQRSLEAVGNTLEVAPLSVTLFRFRVLR